MKRIGILFHRLGPYHWARLNAVGEVLPTVAIELSGETEEYAWDKVDQKGSFERITLFPEEDSRKMPAVEVARRIGKTLDEQKPAVVAIPGWSDKGALAALAWCVRTGIPVIVMSESQHSDKSRRWSHEFIKRRIVDLCSTGIAGGRPHVDYLAALGMPRDRIFTGYDVVDNDYFAARSDAARQESGMLRQRLNLPENFFLASSRFIPKKNLVRLLEAYSHYRRRAGRQPWKLVLLGDGPLRHELLAQGNRLGLGSDVLMPGFKQYDELPAYYGLADVFVHASTTEQWGLVVNEAMASGLPVLVSDRCGCAPDLVASGRNGFAFDPFDVGTLAELMRQLATDSDLAAMGRASREIISRWSPQAFASNLRLAAETGWSAPARRGTLLDHIFVQALIRRWNS